jgi:ribonucleoside-triphosphate reductase
VELQLVHSASHVLPQPYAAQDYAVNPQRAAWGWTSNNSVFAELGQSYDGIARRVQRNGEPGFAW